jgi:hypothetical protein
MDKVSNFSWTPYSQNFMTDAKVILLDVFYATYVNFLCIHPLLYTAGTCDVTFIGVYNTYVHSKCFLPTLYNDMFWLTPSQSTLRFVSSDSHSNAYAAPRSSLLRRPTSHFLQRAPFCFCSENTRNRHCFSSEGQCCEFFASIRLCWDAFGLGLPLEVPLAVTFSSCEWIINSRTKISGKFLCVILSPHDVYEKCV